MFVFTQQVAVGFQPKPVCAQSGQGQNGFTVAKEENPDDVVTGTLEGPRTPHGRETPGRSWDCILMNSGLKVPMREKRALRDPAWSHRDLRIAQV